MFDLPSLKPIISFLMWRVAATAALAASATIGGVYFVVDNSLRGLETSISVTNNRIDDLRSQLANAQSVLTSALNQRFDSLQESIRNDGNQTRGLMKRSDASNDSRFSLINLDKGHVIIRSQGEPSSLASLLENAQYSQLAAGMLSATNGKVQRIAGFPIASDTNALWQFTDSGLVSKLDNTVAIADPWIVEGKPLNKELLTRWFAPCVSEFELTKSGDVYLSLNSNAKFFDNGSFGCPTIDK
jgi:hypothetical protein